MYQQEWGRPIPLQNQARFYFEEVFHESREYIRNYTLPFDMIGVCTLSEGTDASVWRNLQTGETLSLKENDITLVPYNLAQQYHHTLRNERYGIHFRLELYPGVDVFSGCDHVIVENSRVLREEADAIFATQDPILMLARCQEFALRFCLRHWPPRYHWRLEAMKPFEPVLHYIREHGSAATGVEELALLKGCSPDHFTREFRSVFHVPPKMFLQRELFAKATRLLRSPSMTIREIANELDFSSEFYFSKFFKRISGLSPREWRKKQQGFFGGDIGK